MDLFKEISGMFERRFVMNALLPAAAFWSLLGIVVVLDRTSAAGALQAWDAQTGFLKAVEAAAAVIVALATAGLISAATMGILRFFEGYWPWILKVTVGAGAKQWHQRRLAQLAGNHQTETIYFSYPPPTQPDEVMPTLLGNILKSSEVYAKQRYGLDSVLIWPRLYHLLPEGAAAPVSMLRSMIEFHLAVSVTAFLFAVASGAYLLAAGGDWRVFLLCFWGGAAAAWIAYRSSLPSAIAYAEQIRSIFDSYRNQLLVKLRIPLPEDPAHEAATWREVCVFLLRNVREHPDWWRYTESKPGKSDG